MSKLKKRKPRIRKKLVSASSPDSIPFPKVRIEWIDILSDSGWADEKQFNRMKLARYFLKIRSLLKFLLPMIGTKIRRILLLVIEL